MGLMPNEGRNPADALVRQLCREAARSQGGSVLNEPDVANRGAGEDNPEDMRNDEQDHKLGGYGYEPSRDFGDEANVAEGYSSSPSRAAAVRVTSRRKK